MNIGKLLRLFWWEIWGKDAIWQAFPSQELAGSTGRIGVARRGHGLRLQSSLNQTQCSVTLKTIELQINSTQVLGL